MRKVLFLFAELNDLDIDWLISHGNTERVSRGAVLIKERTSIPSLYIVLDGTLEVSITGKARKEIARVGAGEILGEISFVDSRPPLTTVEALTDAVVFSLPRDRISDKLNQDPQFAARFYRALAMFLSHRLRVLTSKISGQRDGASSAEMEEGDELATEVLSGVYLAGKRFERMLKRLTLN